MYALRNLWKARAFTLVAVLTLAIGVGANTAIFSIIDTILLRPLPFHNPDQLVRLYETESAPGTYPFAGPDLADWRAQNHTFQDMAMYGWIHDLNASREGRADISTSATAQSIITSRIVITLSRTSNIPLRRAANAFIRCVHVVS